MQHCVLILNFGSQYTADCEKGLRIEYAARSFLTITVRVIDEVVNRIIRLQWQSAFGRRTPDNAGFVHEKTGD